MPVYAMETYGEVKKYFLLLLVWTAIGDKWLTSRPNRFYPRGGRSPNNQRIGDTRASACVLGRDKIPYPYRESNSDFSVLQPVAQSLLCVSKAVYNFYKFVYKQLDTKLLQPMLILV